MVDIKTIKLVVLVTAIFTALDWGLHKVEFLLPALEALPDLYFPFKIIFLPFILYFLIETFKLKKHALCWAAAAALQLRYYFTGGYDLKTNLIMLGVHYVLILVAFMIVNRKEVRRFI